MHSHDANGESRHTFWLRVREFAVPPSMIESATARRHAGDWAGACAAARVDVDLDLRAVARTRGADLSARIRADLRHLAPDLLRWHWPRIAPDGLLRPGLTVSLARYDPDGVHLVARTPPAWADAGQRISLSLWDGSVRGGVPHPHPHPDQRFRLDLHRHLWDARRSGELRARAGRGGTLSGAPPGPGYAVDRWAAEAALLLHADGLPAGPVTVRLGARRRVAVDPDGVVSGAPVRGPVLPDAATWVLPDVELLRGGLLGVDRLHPLVAAALVPETPPTGAAPPETPPTGAAPPETPPTGATPPDVARLDPVRPGAPQPGEPGAPRVVACRGDRHRIGLVGGVLVALDHDPAEVRREELLTALGGTPLPCLQAIDEAHRWPECLPDVRALLDHGDAAGALAVVEALLGPDALLRHGALRDELETAAQRQVAHGLYRAGLAGGPRPKYHDGHRGSRSRRHRASSR
ncbi:hypothetical protein ACFO1B_02045 [Dactylosporangium siamense]|uniref:Uncharacterized protein n=1 Tax=Dactylosporangium siamense TaxID=685454 RepID=A0A919UFA2_9ACTN|nr:hypothetical protein [Dactylosporangium siamense]GIG48448.1 hypothetical protein Dsi01nite_064890 [Dactylosporangium siamense]